MCSNNSGCESFDRLLAHLRGGAEPLVQVHTLTMDVHPVSSFYQALNKTIDSSLRLGSTLDPPCKSNSCLPAFGRSVGTRSFKARPSAPSRLQRVGHRQQRSCRRSNACRHLDLCALRSFSFHVRHHLCRCVCDSIEIASRPRETMLEHNLGPSFSPVTHSSKQPAITQRTTGKRVARTVSDLFKQQPDSQ